MKFVSYNIQYGTGRDGVVDLARIARAVEGADVIALQEVERFSQRTSLQDQPALLAALLPGYHWVYGPGMDLHADVVAPDGRVTQQRRQFGNMLLSKTPLADAQMHDMGPTWRNRLITARTTVDGKSFTAVAAHMVV